MLPGSAREAITNAAQPPAVHSFFSSTMGVDRSASQMSTSTPREASTPTRTA